MLSGGLGAVLVFLVVLAAFHMIGPTTGKIAESVRSIESELDSDIAAAFSMLPVDMEDVKRRVRSVGAQEDPTDTSSAIQTPDWIQEKMRVLDEL